MQEIRSSSPPVVTALDFDPDKSRARHYSSLKLGLKLKNLSIKKILDDRKYSPFGEREFLREIFGYQDGETKYVGLMDSASEEDFNKKLPNPKSWWDETDGANNSNNNYYYYYHSRIKKHFKYFTTI